MEVTTCVEALREKDSVGSSANMQAVTCSERRAGLEKDNAGADAPEIRGRLTSLGKMSGRSTQRSRRGNGDGMHA